jgi:hypothetical protein
MYNNNNITKYLKLSGSIGYTLLEKNINKYEDKYKHINILILADMHDTMEYCKNDGLFISEWFSKVNMKKKTKILLEEVPRLGVTLKELWPSSPHTQKLKNMYLMKNTPIEGIDPRPFMIPYSWGLLLETNHNTIENSLNSKESKEDVFPTGNDTLKEHFIELINFYSLKHKFFISNIKTVYNLNYLSSQSNNSLGLHYLDLKKSIIKFIKKNNNFKNMKIKDIVKTNVNIMTSIDEHISNIMEWYTIAKIFQGLNEGIDSFIIHAGLAHTTKIISLLQKYYGFLIVKESGITNISNFDIMNNGCLEIPERVANLFGGSKYKFNYGFNGNNCFY